MMEIGVNKAVANRPLSRCINSRNLLALEGEQPLQLGYRVKDSLSIDKYELKGNDFEEIMDIIENQSNQRNKNKLSDFRVGQALKGLYNLTEFTSSNFQQIGEYME